MNATTTGARKKHDQQKGRYQHGEAPDLAHCDRVRAGIAVHELCGGAVNESELEAESTHAKRHAVSKQPDGHRDAREKQTTPDPQTAQMKGQPDRTPRRPQTRHRPADSRYEWRNNRIRTGKLRGNGLIAAEAFGAGVAFAAVFGLAVSVATSANGFARGNVNTNNDGQQAGQRDCVS